MNFHCFSSEVPTPTVSITSGTVIAGSDVTLTCTVDLDPAVDVPVTVNTVWTGQNGFMESRMAQLAMGNTISTAMVSSFGRDQSGVYTCTATVSSTSSFISSSMASKSIRVTSGKGEGGYFVFVTNI